jgi:hypothetical protein
VTSDKKIRSARLWWQGWLALADSASRASRPMIAGACVPLARDPNLFWSFSQIVLVICQVSDSRSAMPRNRRGKFIVSMAWTNGPKRAEERLPNVSSLRYGRPNPASRPCIATLPVSGTKWLNSQRNLNGGVLLRMNSSDTFQQLSALREIGSRTDNQATFNFK